MDTTAQHVAQMDTPQAVNVPNSLTGLIVWATGRFGVGVLMAVAFAYATNKVYQDYRLLTDRMITAFENRAKVDTETATTLQAQTTAIASLTQVMQQMAQDLKRNPKSNGP